MIPSNLLYSLFLIPLFTIGGICSYSDTKYGKIRNIYIILGIGWVIFLYSFLFFYTYFGLCQDSNLLYLKDLILNGTLAFIVGYILWYVNLWAAGDAKLFTLCAFLLPLEFYSRNYFSYFPSFSLLVDTFVLVLLFLIFKICVREVFLGIMNLKRYVINNPKGFSIHSKKETQSGKSNFKKLSYNLSKIGKLFFTYLFVFVFLQLIRKDVGLVLQKFISNLGFIYLSFFAIQWFAFRKILKNKMINLIIITSGVVGSLYLIISGKPIVLWEIVKMTLFFMIIVGLSVQLLNLYIEKNEVRRIKIKDIKLGIFPTAKDLFRIAKILKEQGVHLKLGKISSDGLDNKQIRLMKNLFKDKPEAEITIYKTFPFAPFLMASVLISLLTRSSFLPLIMKLFSLMR